MTIMLPQQCIKCNGKDIRPQGDSGARCGDCGMMFQAVGSIPLGPNGEDEAVVLPSSLSIDLRNAQVYPIMPELLAKVKDGKITGFSIGSHAHQETKPCKPHVVDGNDCDLVDKDPATSKLAHELFDVWAWVHWVSVQRTGNRFVVKVKHDYPIDIRLELSRWLQAYEYIQKCNATFELQVKQL